jgi:hypothetical protein
MVKTTALIGVAFLSGLYVGCSDISHPVAPSALASWPELTGTYTLTLTPCQLQRADEILSSTPIGPYQSTWTFTQEQDVVTGRFSKSSPPAVSYGVLTGRVDRSGEMLVTNLQFSWSSSHVGLIQFSASGDGDADKTHVSGTVSGEESYIPTFGGSAGPRSACSGTQMPFTFTRRS